MSQGIGSKTTFYYLLTVMIQKYIASIVMNGKRHSVVTVAILGFSIILTTIFFILV
ncbi:hypothetical protein [Bacillus sp. NPDC057893]|uniref:hypothetical protein n=1 Tax=Bacillus sp. NPDC057893 TaxID=3346273 RepID=UPI00366CD9FE